MATLVVMLQRRSNVSNEAGAFILHFRTDGQPCLSKFSAGKTIRRYESF